MRLISLSACRPGMRLGKNIYNDEGVVLLGKNVQLTEKYIQLLTSNAIDVIYILDERTEDIEIPELLSDETRKKALQEIRFSFRNVMDQSNRKKAVNTSKVSQNLRGVMDMIIDDISKHKESMIMLMNINVTDNYLFHHSLNVCTYSTMLGVAAGMTRDELMILGIGALLHDIGKIQIHPDILFKPGKLTDEEYALIKKHTDFGYDILRKEPNIPLLAAHCAFQHHERLDGTGYPRGIKGNEIHEFAQWIGVADSYDAMTTSRVYRKAMLPHQALEILFTCSGDKFSPEKIAMFRDKVAVYPIGVSVKLDTGEIGTVVDVNHLCPHRPIVRILQDVDGQDLKNPYEVDLSKSLHTMISDIDLSS